MIQKSPVTTRLQERSTSELREMQLQDESIGFVLKAKEGDAKPTPQQVKGMSRTVRRLCQLWDRLKCQDGQLWRLYDDGTGRKEWLQLANHPFIPAYGDTSRNSPRSGQWSFGGEEDATPDEGAVLLARHG